MSPAEYESLKNNISNELQAINKKLHERFPGPRNDLPTLKGLCDVFMFYYQESVDKYVKKEDLVSQNVAMLINDRMQKIIDSANVLYNLSESKFIFVVTNYVKTKELANHPLNSIEVIQKRAKIIENINIAKRAEEHKET